MQELGLSSYSSERDDAKDGAAKEGQQWHALFNTFYRLVFEHIASLVEVRPRIYLFGICSMPCASSWPCIISYRAVTQCLLTVRSRTLQAHRRSCMRSVRKPSGSMRRCEELQREGLLRNCAGCVAGLRNGHCSGRDRGCGLRQVDSPCEPDQGAAASYN